MSVSASTRSLPISTSCENEGLSVQELAYVAERSRNPPPRGAFAHSVDRASDWAHPPALGLVDAFLNPTDGRSHVVHLSDKGRALRDRLDTLIRRAVPIDLAPG